MATKKAVRKNQNIVASAGGSISTPAKSTGNANSSFNLKYATDSMGASNYNVYSPYYSTDFLELPLTVAEKRRLYRHFYERDPIVGRAIDLHTDLPISKIRLSMPQCQDQKRAHEIFTFYEEMCHDINLFSRLLEVTHEYNLMGDVFIFAEWDEHKKSWANLVILDPDLVKITTFPFTNKVRIELVPDPQTRELISQAQYGGDPEIQDVIESIPSDIRERILENIPLLMDTDPLSGSYVYHLSRKRSGYYEMGTSMLERLLTTLLYRDKLRQSQTQIATRNMTPKHLVWADDISSDQVHELREHVDLAQVDPEYAIVTNFEVHWDMVGANDRMLNLASEWEESERLLMAGLGMTRELLTGDGLYSGGRISLEILNTTYMLHRETLQEYVERSLFRPVAIENDFIEKDENGNEILIYPRLSFTRLSIRDNADTFDSLFNLYQKGSISVDVILDLLNIDPSSTKEKLEKDLFTVNDSSFNEFMRAVYNEAGRGFVEKFQILEKLADYLGMKAEQPPAEGEEAK